MTDDRHERKSSIIERIEHWLIDHPGERITAEEGCAMFRCTHNTWVQSLHEVRRRGVVRRVKAAHVWWVERDA